MQTSVMIVEDEGLIANDIALQLKSIGYSVDYIAASGEEALEHLRHSRPDLVLMDIRLKGEMDGVDAAMRIRSTHRLPVIILTAHADSDTLARAKHVEPFGYLVKPFRQVNLFSAIEMAVHKHRGESALIEREAWLWSVLQSTASPTVVVDAHGVVRFLNASAETLLQCEASELAGSNWTKVMPFLNREGQVINDSLLRETNDLHRTKLPSGIVLRRRDGCDLMVEGEVSCASSSGTFAGAIVTVRDVSLRNEKEALMRQQQKMLALGRLAGGVAHNFNNLLTAIIGHLSLLAAEDTSTGRNSRIEAALDAANLAAGFTEHLLTISGSHVLDTEEIDVNARVHQLLRLVAPSLGPAIVNMVDLDPSAGMIRLNTALADQLVLNLVMNARNAMAAGGVLTISTSHVERSTEQADATSVRSFVRLLVKDSGPAISPEVKERLFEPFFNINRDGPDDGFGLSVVYGIVKDAAGYISIESNELGNSFEVLLPRLQEFRPGTTYESSPAADVSRGKTILLVEDDSIVRSLLQEYLSQLGFKLLVADCGPAALDASENYPGHIDLLISDFRMPNMDGLTLSKKITVSRPATKVLIMSGYTGDPRLSEALSLSDFIQKPFLPPALLEKIQELIGSGAQVHAGN